MNNKTLKKLTMALAFCGALCGTAMAAPKGGAPAKGKAPVAMRAKTPAPARHEVAKHTPPPPRHHEPRHRHNHRCDHRCKHHGDNWCVLGATVVGGLLGGLLGAAL